MELQLIVTQVEIFSESGPNALEWLPVEVDAIREGPACSDDIGPCESDVKLDV